MTGPGEAKLKLCTPLRSAYNANVTSQASELRPGLEPKCFLSFAVLTDRAS